MIAPTPLPSAAPRSLSTLARSTAIAVVVAAGILTTIVLPAEYGIDPLGTGRKLGLTQIASPAVLPIQIVSSTDGPLAPVMSGPVGLYPAEFKFDVFEIALAPYEYVEYKYQLQKGATMLYSWSATGGLLHDFHGERAVDEADGGPAEESFDKQNRREASGSLTAPFSGIHGWYWENPGAETITIRLTSAGYYTAAIEIRSDRSRRTRTLRTLETLPPLAGPSTGAVERE